MRLSKYHLAILALILTNIIWGASTSIFKWSLESITPFTFAFIRFFISSIILLPFTIHHLTLSRQDLVALIVLSITGFFLHIGLLLVGLDISSSINSSVIGTAAPIFLLIGSVIFFKEKVKKHVVIGTGISLTGVLLIILRPIFDKGLDGTILGNIFFLLSTLCFVIYTILLKEYTTHLKATTVTFYLFAISTMIFFPFSLMESPKYHMLDVLNLQALTGILFGALFTSIVGYLFFNFAIKYIKASEVGVFLYMGPFVNAAVAVPLLGEKITPVFLFGGLFVFLGILVAEKRIRAPFPYLHLHKG